MTLMRAVFYRKKKLGVTATMRKHSVAARLAAMGK